MILAVQASDLEYWLGGRHVSAIDPSLLAVSCDSTYVGAIDVDRTPRDSEVKVADKSNCGVLVQANAELGLVLDENVVGMVLPVAKLQAAFSGR